MGRLAESWKLKPHPSAGILEPGRNYHVRFRHEGHRFDLTTGERDPARAGERAKAIYARVVSGRTKPVRRGPSPLLPIRALFAEWLASLEGVLDEQTVKTYRRVYVKTHFLAFFASLEDMTEASLGDYGRARLRKVTRKTVLKELGALRSFLRWCKEQGVWTDVPPIPPLPQRSKGVRAGKQRAKPVELSEEQVEAVLAELPVISVWRRDPKGRADASRRYPVRARFIVAWETALRPETLNALSVPEHYTKGATHLTVTDDIDKARFGRELPLSERARAALDEICPEEGLIFGRHAYNKYLKAAAKASGLEEWKAFAAYDLRHARATSWVEQTPNLPAVAYLMGHRRVTTTALYVKATQRAAESIVGASAAPKAKGGG